MFQIVVQVVLLWPVLYISGVDDDLKRRILTTLCGVKEVDIKEEDGLDELFSDKVYDELSDNIIYSSECDDIYIGQVLGNSDAVTLSLDEVNKGAKKAEIILKKLGIDKEVEIHVGEQSN